MSLMHVKSNTVGDFTGTVTLLNSAGATTTGNATDLIRPADWNSAHNEVRKLSGNTLGSSSLQGTDIVLVGGTNITLSAATDTNGASIHIIGQNAGGAVKTMLSYQPRQLGASTSTQWTNNQLWMLPFRVDPGFAVSASTLMLLASLGGTYTSAVAATWAETFKWAIYSQHSTNASRFDSMSSGSFSWQVWNSGTSSASWAMNGSTSSSAATGILTQVSGVRMINVPLNFSVSEGLYLMAMAASTSSAGYSGLLSRYAKYMDGPALVAMGSGFGSAAATNIGFIDAGTYGTTSGAFPSSLSLGDIKQHSNLNPWFKLGAI